MSGDRRVGTKSPLQGLGADGPAPGALQWVEEWLPSVCLPV